MKNRFLSLTTVSAILGILVFPNVVFATITATLSDTIGDATISYINPVDSAIDRSTDTFYALLSDGTVQLYDDEGIFLSSFSAVDAPGETIFGIAVHPVSKYVYAASSTGEVKIYDDEGVYVSSYGAATFTGNPRHIAVDATGSYVTSSDDGALYFFNSSNVFVTSEVLAGANFVEVEGTTVYASVEGGSQVFSYTRTGTPITSVEVGYSINSLAVRANGTFAIGIQTRDDRNVFIFDASGTVIDAASQSDSLNSVATTEVTSADLIVVGYESNDVGTVKAFDIAQDVISHYIPRIPPERLANPSGIAIGSDGSIFVLDADYHKINVYNSAGTYVRSFGGYGSTNGKLKFPTDIALDSNNNVYIADRDNDRVQVFSSAGTYLDQWAVTEAGSYNGPSSLAVYGSRVYVVGESGDEQLVQVFSLDGTSLFTFGGAGSDPGQFLNVQKVEVTADGNVFVFDQGQGVYGVHQFTSEGVFVATIDEYDDSGINGIPLITGMAFDANDNFYFSDNSGRKVVILNDQNVLVGKIEFNDQLENLFTSPGAVAVSSTKIFVGDVSVNSVFIFNYTDDVQYASEEIQSTIRSGSAPRKTQTRIEQPQAPVCEGGPFLTNLRRGNRSDEVRRLQDFLRSQQVYTGPTTGFFGPLTQGGVNNFQLLYRKDILDKAGLSAPTGNWYPLTRAQANKINGCVL